MCCEMLCGIWNDVLVHNSKIFLSLEYGGVAMPPEQVLVL